MLSGKLQNQVLQTGLLCCVCLADGALPESVHDSSRGCRAGELGGVGGSLGLEGLSHLAGLQAIAAIQGAANLASTGSLSGVDLLAIGKQAGVLSAVYT